MDSTTYYNTKASRYITDTFNADMSAIRNRFISYLPAHVTILDAGCGPGRDVKAFVEAGYEVYAMDASEAMVSHCRTIIGHRVQLSTFQDYTTNIKFDGIWACASLLHLEPAELQPVLPDVAVFDIAVSPDLEIVRGHGKSPLVHAEQPLKGKGCPVLLSARVGGKVYGIG